MNTRADTVAEYIDALPADRKDWVSALRQTILTHLPAGFEEQMQYGMPSYVVPHSLYPAGYHCDAKQPLPFLALASQKSAVNLHHMGLYADADLMLWFTEAYAAQGVGKLDMGKSCIRFKKQAQTPLTLIGELVAKMSVAQWIALYEATQKR
jgi:uncharacterized protein YdhG (YjbR/CyaY superfamily)